MEPGRSYWLYTNNNCEIWITSNVGVEDNFAIELSIGWNLIGLPSNTSIGKENLTILFDETEYTWNEAIDNSIIFPFVFGWNKIIQNYVTVDTLYSGLGYWTYSKEYCILLS